MDTQVTGWGDTRRILREGEPGASPGTWLTLRLWDDGRPSHLADAHGTCDSWPSEPAKFLPGPVAGSPMEGNVMGLLSITLDVADDRTTLSFHGELDMSCQADVESAVEPISASRGSDVVFDLTDLTFIDSSGLLALLDAKTALNRNGMEVWVVGAHGSVLRVIEVTGLSEVLNLRT
jgi:anti-anti-sigma factor